MPSRVERFFELTLKAGALSFGQFTLKSGRLSPYFFDLGRIQNGPAIAELGTLYAETLMETGWATDCLYGPAYKGIPLVVTTAIALSDRFGKTLPYAFNRKEAKDHGEGGRVVGGPLKGHIVLIDDVITAGTAIRESVAIIQAAGAHAWGAIVALDREERGGGTRSAVEEARRDSGLRIRAIATFSDLLNYLSGQRRWKETRQALGDYRDRYGTGGGAPGSEPTVQ
ncbi:MAG: orotate phosphoribosyltransferase [Gammaproteobacteria bacterium]